MSDSLSLVKPTVFLVHMHMQFYRVLENKNTRNINMMKSQSKQREENHNNNFCTLLAQTGFDHIQVSWLLLIIDFGMHGRGLVDESWPMCGVHI
jgi:hypothetical protein